ncbi:MAG: Cof-type HAD-IIB family hydrolase [Erysipelotrichaceae bacterium]|nr:Cof-type HAD-IIB family hydrolase [Erysipelotrichaceae bacterium]
MIKAIFFDIDGTLLSHISKSVPASTKEALHLLKQKGIYTFIASGRHISEMKNLPMDDLDFTGYITLNGQYCFNDDGIIYDLPIEQDDIHSIIKYIDKNPFPCIFVEDELMYINYHNDAVQIIQDAISTSLPDINDLHRGYNHKIYQVIPYDIDKNKEKEILKLMPHSKSTRWHDLAIDIIPKNGGKQNGIQQVLNYYNIKRNETMAFGDGDNDIDMLKFVEIAVVMGNASDKVKEFSDYVTDDVDSEGIYNALKKYKVI